MTMLSVVIPALNEEDSIVPVIERVQGIRQSLMAVGVHELELIVVDDGSTDRTADLVTSTGAARLLRHPSNRGYGAALKSGFAAARGEWIAFLDADGTYPAECLPELCRVAQAQQADIVTGSRMAGAESQMPAMRRLGNWLFAHLVSLISAERISDSASGMRVFKKDILERIYPLPDGLNLTPVMSTRALHEQLKMVEVPIPYAERKGRSKLSVLRDGARFAQSIVWTALHYNPVRPIGLIAGGALGLAALIAAGVIVLRLSGVDQLDAWGIFAVFSALVFGVAGVSLLALGISFNYFVALFHKEPVRQGLFGRSLFRRRIDQHFGWMGLAALLVGVALGGASLVLGTQGWPVTRLWFYYLVSASLSLIGIQLIVAWIQMQVLDALRARDNLVATDLRGIGAAAAAPYQDFAKPIEIPGR